MLNPRQKRFVHEYLIDLNATQAAIRAGYSKKTAVKQGCRLLTNADIQSAVTAGKKKILDKLEVTVDRIVAEYARLGFSDMSRYAEWNNEKVTLTDSTKLTPEHTAAVQEVTQTTTKDGGSIKIKLHDKKGALDSLSRHLGLFTDKTEYSGEVVVYHSEKPNKPADAGMQ